MYPTFCHLNGRIYQCVDQSTCLNLQPSKKTDESLRKAFFVSFLHNTWLVVDTDGRLVAMGTVCSTDPTVCDSLAMSLPSFAGDQAAELQRTGNTAPSVLSYK
jgi:hypothetical protein